MGAMIYFSFLITILAFLTLSAQARTFPGEGKAVVIIYGRSSSSLHLHLTPILSAAINNKDIMVEAPARPKPKPPSPKPASPISELTSSSTSSSTDHDDDGGIMTMVTGTAGTVEGRKVLTPPPSPKPASPTHYVAPHHHHERSPPAESGGSYYYSSSS